MRDSFVSLQKLRIVIISATGILFAPYFSTIGFYKVDQVFFQSRRKYCVPPCYIHYDLSQYENIVGIGSALSETIFKEIVIKEIVIKNI